MNNSEPGKLYVVSTPIGNLEDITIRALGILKQVDFIAAEDTRHVKKLLNHYDISKKVVSYFAGKEETKARRILNSIQAGSTAALVSDAGTPGISDPGLVIVRAALSEGIEVVPIPGPSSPIAALSVSGLPTGRFVFEGFLPRKKGKRLKKLTSLLNEERTIVLFESPHRVLATLREMAEIFNGRQIVIGREITKKFEEFLRGAIDDILETLSKRDRVKGEFTLILEGKP